MSWILLTLCSSLILGLYEVCKKSSVRENAVLPVLFASVLTMALLWLPWIVLSHTIPSALPHRFLHVEDLYLYEHALIFIKAILVGSCWILGYFSLKHLPISIAAPIRATSPLWVLIAAVLFFDEHPTAIQWTGMAITLAAFYSLSLVGRKEGIHFHRNIWIGVMILSTLLSAASALYDKFLLQSAQLDPATLQAWFSVYLVVFIFPFLFARKKAKWKSTALEWRWAIPGIGVLLVCTDIIYYTALAQEGAMISVISVLRRASVVVSFLAGYLLFKEKHIGAKAICILALILGISLLTVW